MRWFVLALCIAIQGVAVEQDQMQKANQWFAIELNNRSWTVIDQESPEEGALERLTDMAHASLYHWSQVGETVNLARGHHLVSRAYAKVGIACEALRHAEKCLSLCEDNGFGDWDLAFALEANARAHHLSGNKEEHAAFLLRAKEAGDAIAEEEDRKIFFGELQKVPGYEE